MVNYCVCGACKNSSLSGHRVHRFPNKKKDGAIFRAWVRFVQVKRRDFSSASASESTVVCGVHFRSEDYRPGDMMEFNMGYRSKNRVRLRAGAVPSVHASSGSPAGGKRDGHGSVRDAARRKRELCTDLAEIASNEGGDASSASAAVFVADPEQEPFSPLAPQSSVHHFGSQCDLRPSHRSSEEEASRRNYSRRNYGHTIVKMEFEEEPCRIKDEDTEEQIDPMAVNEKKKHQFQKSQHFKNEDGNTVIQQTEKCFAQKRARKTGQGSLTCSECGKSCTQNSDLKKHMRIHTGEKPFTCSQCGKSFTQKSSLRDHLLNHSGVRSFSCDQCEKTFVLESNLKRHLKIHTSVKPHVCSFCGKSFSLQKYLKAHERFHTGVRPYVCFVCGKSFITSSHLKSHQRTHTGETSNKCSHCGKSFSRSETLKDHESIHTGEKLYVCSDCGKSFTTHSRLKIHQRVHTGEKPYKCSSCGKSFTQSSSLRSHERKHCPKSSK